MSYTKKESKELKVLRKFVQYIKERHYAKLQLNELTNMYYKFNPESKSLPLSLLQTVPGVEYDNATKIVCFKTYRQLQELSKRTQLLKNTKCISKQTEKSSCDNISLTSRNSIVPNHNLIPLKKRHLLKTFVTNNSLKIQTNFFQGSYCTLCHQNIEHTSIHEGYLDHILREMYRTDRKYFYTPYTWVKIECNSDNIKEELIINNKKQIINLNIINQTDIIIYFKLLQLIPNECIYIENSIPSSLEGYQRIQIKVEITCSKQSLLLFPILLLLKSRENDEVTPALKDMVFRVQSPYTDDILPTAAYRSAEKAYLQSNEQPVIAGAPDFSVTSTTKLVSKMKLNDYPIPPGLIEALNCGLRETDHITPPVRSQIRKIRRVLQSSKGSSPDDCLTEQNYETVLNLLLHIEEYQEVKDLSTYNKNGQIFHRVSDRPHLFELMVENLSEHRPSVMRGDRIIVRPELDLKEFFQYEGVIHEVRLNSIYIGFEKSFFTKYPEDTKYTIQFLNSRDSTRKEHRAVQLLQSHNVKKFLFPQIDMLLPVGPLPKLKFFNKLIENNAEQREAVTNIVRGTSYPVPFLLFGPPGTGKTMTIVEAIKQIWQTNSTSHILVCAPSNSAANVITERLIDDIECRSELIRLLAASQDWNNLPSSIKPYTNYDEKCQEFTYPSLKALMKFRVIIVTLLTASRLVSAMFPIKHFTHVFIDECGHATETEALVPIAGILTSIRQPTKIHGNIILAGDPKQLGPIILSPMAKTYGFEISILERLMTRIPLYHRDPITNKYNSRVLTKLVKNFRSHEALLYLPNQKFYDGELIACASKVNSNLALHWRKLPNKDFPIVFHSSFGSEDRDPNSPSYFNSSEIELVMEYLNQIINKKLNPNINRVITQSDVGIIAPYKKQIQKLQRRCEDKGFRDIVIGSVEQFQGEEKHVIIMSTVRSRKEVNANNKKSILGFLTNPKRFNVALTRAKSLLIVIGNPNVLQHDENWLDFIDYCDNNKALINKTKYIKKPLVSLKEINEHFQKIQMY